MAEPLISTAVTVPLKVPVMRIGRDGGPPTVLAIPHPAAPPITNTSSKAPQGIQMPLLGNIAGDPSILNATPSPWDVSRTDSRSKTRKA